MTEEKTTETTARWTIDPQGSQGLQTTVSPKYITLRDLLPDEANSGVYEYEITVIAKPVDD